MTIKLIFKMAVITACVLCVEQNEALAQNLIDMQGWVIGQGSSGVFGQNGQTSENTREWELDLMVSLWYYGKLSLMEMCTMMAGGIRMEF